MMHIWRHVRKLCYDLQEAPSLQHVSVHFMENQYATWSVAGKPLERMGAGYCIPSHFTATGTGYFRAPPPSDIVNILYILRLLANVTKAQIHLPVSLADSAALQEQTKTIEEVMTKIRWLDDEYKKRVIDSIGADIDDSENGRKPPWVAIFNTTWMGGLAIWLCFKLANL